MRKQFLLFMALFALASANKLFAANEAAATPDPTDRGLTALSLPVSISSITKENFAKTVWAPAVYTRSNQSTVQLVAWSDDDNAMKFAALDVIGDGKSGNDLNSVEHPFIIKLGGAAKQVTVNVQIAKSASDGNNGSGFKIYEWDGTKWKSLKERGWNSNATLSADISLSSRYLMIASYGHGGGSRKLTQLDVSKFEAPANFDATPTFTLASSESWGQQFVNKSVVKNIAPTNLNDGAKVSNWSAKITGDNASMFSVDCDEYTGLCRVTYTPTVDGSHNATLTLTATDNEVSPSVVAQQSMTLSGTGDATAVIELTKQGEATASTSHDFGSVIGLNAATSLTLNVSKHNFDSDLAYEWKTQDAAFGYSVNGNQVTITAKPNAAQDAQSVHTGVLTVKGKSAGSDTYDVTKDFTVTLTVNPRTIPTNTWNIGTTLFERNEYSNVVSSNSDAPLNISVGNDNSYLTYASNKLTTQAISSSSQAAGSISITAPATDTYAAINEVRAITLVANPTYLPLEINSQEVFDLVYSSSSSNVTWDATNNVVKMSQNGAYWANDKDFVFVFKSAPYKLSFTITASTETSGGMWGGGTTYPKLKVYQGTSTSDLTQIGSDTTFNGSVDIEKMLNSNTRCIRIRLSDIKGDGTLSNVRIESSSPTLTIAESSTVLKANAKSVYDKVVNFSVLKYASIKVQIVGDDFGLVKGSADPSSEIVYTNADGLNDNNTTPCSFKVCYSGSMDNVTSKTATIKFYDQNDAEIVSSTIAVSIAPVDVLTFEAPNVGSYTYQYTGASAVTVNEQKTRELADAPYEVTLTASTAPSGYKFFGWYEKNGEDKTYLSNTTTLVTSIETTKTIGCEFVTESTPIFYIKGETVPYADLNTACTSALSSSSKIVVLSKSGILPLGDYTIPAGVTLMIPFDDNRSFEFIENPALQMKKEQGIFDKYSSDLGYDKSELGRMLTLSEGSILSVNGVLCLNGIRWGTTVSDNAESNRNPMLSGDCRLHSYYGCITTNPNSKIIINNAGKLYCWGRIRGEGSVIAESGSLVKECLVYTDHRESGAYYDIAKKYKCFTMNQFYIQDIQVPITYKYGSTAYLFTILHVNSLDNGETQFVGSNSEESFIALKEGSTFTKSYSLATDRLIFDLNGNVDIRYFVLPFYYQGNQKISSEAKIFSLNNNWTFNINSGTTHIQNELSMSAGAELNIAKDAEVIMDEGVTLYVFDEEDWGEFACRQRIIPLYLPSYELKNNFYRDNNIQLFWGYWGANRAGEYYAIRTPNNITDAIIKVNGSLTVTGGTNKIWNDNSLQSGLYTTTHGAQIISDGGGLIKYLTTSGNQTYIECLAGAGKNTTVNGEQKIDVPITPAQLLNANGSYTSSSGYAGATQFVYKHGFWVNEEIPASKITVSSDKVQMDDASETIENSTYSIAKGQLLAADEVTIEEGATVDVDQDASMYVAQTFVINASENNSGNLIGANKVALDSNAVAYFDYTFNTPAMRWNAIAFPWKVDATTGVKVGDKTLVLGKDFDVVYYDGDIRAKQGKVDECWRYVEDDIDTSKIANPEILLPGRLYMILFATSQDVVRFAKKANASINNTDLSVANYSGNDEDANWNGIANPTLYHAYLTTGVEEGQVYNSETKSYTQIAFDNTSFPVGKPVFVQAQSEQSVLINKDAPTSAPMRAAVNANTQRAEVEIWHNGVSSDMVKVCTNDDALDTYTIGSDLSKAGVSDQVAQMWVNRYNAKLCKNTIAPIDDVAEYPLTIFTPQNGEYTLSLRSISDETALYLTQDGEIIADLSEDFTITFEKGNSSKYGLRMVIKKQPGVVTSFDEVKTSKSEMEKVIYRGNLYIIRNNQVYNVAGQLVK